jgi:predicted ester cyclase
MAQATRETTRTAEEVARSYFAAVAARDADAMAAHWSFEGVDELLSVGIFRGPDEVRELFRGIFAAIPDLEIVVDRIIAGEGVAAVRWRSSGVHTGGPLFGIEATGRLIELRGCDCLEVEDGMLVRNTAYMDGAQLARAQGLLPPKDSGAEKALLRAFNAANRARRALRERLGG